MTKPAGAVFVGTEESVFVTRSRDALRQRGVDVKIVDPYAYVASRGGNSLVHKLRYMFDRYRNVKQQISTLPTNQTAVIHFLSLDCFWLVPVLANHFDRVVGLAYGSDVLRRAKSRDFLLRVGLKRLDVVAATNNNVLDALVADFPFLTSRLRRVIRFGLPVFDELQKIEATSTAQARSILGFDTSRKLISLGYSASPGQRQIELIDYFAARYEQFDDCDFVVPVQYGSGSVTASIVEKCAAMNAKAGRTQFCALTKFHDPNQSALMRRATDVLINHSVSDAFSGTVQEVVYAGNLVLAGDHLPYDNMPGSGSAIRFFRGLEDAASNLTTDSFESWRRQAAASAGENRRRLHETSSWDAVFPDWQNILSRAPS